MAAFSATAIVLAGCAGGGGSEPSADSDEQITLTLATFNDFGYDDELLQEYMDENPNIKIVHNKAAISQDARTNYFAKLGKEGLADIEAVEVDWFTEAMQYSDLLAEVPDSAKGRWLDWKEAAATDADGRLVGFGTDIGPQASATAPTCSRLPACRPTPTRSPRCSTVTGTTTSTSPTSTRRPPASR